MDPSTNTAVPDTKPGCRLDGGSPSSGSGSGASPWTMVIFFFSFEATAFAAAAAFGFVPSGTPVGMIGIPGFVRQVLVVLGFGIGGPAPAEGLSALTK